MREPGWGSSYEGVGLHVEDGLAKWRKGGGLGLAAEKEKGPEWAAD
jgi:hypothetical protein